MKSKIEKGSLNNKYESAVEKKLEAEQKRLEKLAKRLSALVIRKVSRGKDDFSAIAWNTPSLYSKNIKAQTAKTLEPMINERLADQDVSIRIYNGGSDYDADTRIAVERIGDKEIDPK